MDFRMSAVRASELVMEKRGRPRLFDMNESVCLSVGCGKTVQYVAEIPCVIISGLCILSCVVIWPLRLFGLINYVGAMILLFYSLGVLLVLRKAQVTLLNMYLRSRDDSLIPVAKADPSRMASVNVGLEDAATVEKTKVVVEDQGVCFLDADRRRLLLEGCLYRYVIMADDVEGVEPVSGYALSGAKISCRIAGEPLSFVLTTAGQGPVASMIHAFLPFLQAGGLSTRINATLFGEKSKIHMKAAPIPTDNKTEA